MAKISKDYSTGTLHPRENQSITGTLTAAGSEIVVESHGNSIVTLDLRGTFVATVDIQGTVDGVNWFSMPCRPYYDLGSYQFGASADGVFVADCGGFKGVKAHVSSYTSGTITATLLATQGHIYDPELSDNVVSATAASAAALTVTLPAAANLTHHITHIEIVRFTATAQTATATPNLVTTTNLPGSLGWSLPHEASAVGSVYEKTLFFSRPLRASAPGVATTIVCPAVTGIIWKVNVTYFLAP